MLLALLRSAIHQQEVETIYFQQATEQDWLKCYLLALHQGVLSLAWEGVKRLPTSCQPPLNVKLTWALREKEQREKYSAQCQALNELSQLLAQHGIGIIVLKGVGLSRLYPVPTHRESGDIDIYTYSADKTLMTDAEANRLADEIILKQGAILDDSPSEKHSKFGIYGATFENHRKFLHIAECQAISKAERWLRSHLSTSIVELQDGKYRIVVPSISFDSVFIPLHAAQHYGEGLSLKHLCDWAILIQQKGFTPPSDLDDKYLKLTVSTLTQLCNQHLGLSIPVEADCRLVNDMMLEILHPRYFGKTPSGGKCRQYLFRLRNRVHIFRLKHRLLGVSFWGKIRGWCMRKIKEYTSR